MDNIDFAPTNDRGFIRGNFSDRNGVECSLQESSLATDACIWLGCTHQANTRMHLNREQVAALLPALQYFVENGRLPTKGRCRDDT